MPTYSFKCKSCEKEWDINLRIAQRNDKQKCECGGDLERGFDAPVIHGLSSTIGVKGWGVAPPANSDKATERF